MRTIVSAKGVDQSPAEVPWSSGSGPGGGVPSVGDVWPGGDPMWRRLGGRSRDPKARFSARGTWRPEHSVASTRLDAGEPYPSEARGSDMVAAPTSWLVAI
jgi:hypothetical protein